MILLSLLASTATLSLQVTPERPEEGDPIVVTGSRPDRDPRGVAEEPYPETERVPLGSRIARRVERRPFRTVATETGLAGMVGNSGDGNWDGTGGSGHGVRGRRVTECVPDHEQVSEAVACALFRVKRNTDVGEFELAAQSLQPLLARRGMTDWEHYYVGYFAYRLADALDDDERRDRALQMMLASGRMSADDRLNALRMLAAIALEEGDDPAAIERLEQLVEADPDARTLVNLAVLYARYGRNDQARLRMTEAVTLARQAGDTPPEEWSAFLGQLNRGPDPRP